MEGGIIEIAFLFNDLITFNLFSFEFFGMKSLPLGIKLSARPYLARQTDRQRHTDSHTKDGV